MQSPVVFVAVALAALFAVAGLLTWLVPRLFKRRPSFRKVAKRFGIAYVGTLVVVTFLVLPLLASYMISKASTRPQDRDLTETPATYGRPFREVTFSAQDGVILSGWYLEGDLDTVVAWTHGLFRDRHEVLERACKLNELGHPVLIYDLRSHGQSTPSTLTMGWSERLDALGAYEWLRAENPNGRITLIGVSMGAVATLMAAPEVSGTLIGVVAESPFNSLRETVGRHVNIFLKLPGFPFSNLFVWNLSRIGRFDANALDCTEASRRLGDIPVLLIYGGDDERMPEQGGRSLLSHLASPESRMEVFPGAGHGHAFDVDPERYVDLVHSFIERSGKTSD